MDTAALEEAARQVLKAAQAIETAFATVPAAAKASGAVNTGYQTQVALLALLCTQMVTAIRQLTSDTGGHADRLRATKAIFEANEQTNRLGVTSTVDRHWVV